MAFDSGDQGKQIFFELEPDEFFGTDVAHCLWAAGVGIVPGFVYGLGYEVDPAAVGD